MPICLAVLAREVTKTLYGKLGSGFPRINSSDKFLANKVIVFVCQRASMASIAGTNCVLF